MSLEHQKASQGHNIRQEFYQRIDPHNLTPLWEVLGALVPETPTPQAQPHKWDFALARDYLMEAGDLITAEEAERRVLVLENPGLRGQSRITDSLYAGLQLILPNEVAPAHRHTQSALRLVLSGEGAYTAVDGERTTMRRGDFIITPAWTYHDHGNEGTEPVIWLDGLDIPIVEMLSSGFREGSPEKSQIVEREEGDSLARYGNNMLPVNFEGKQGQATKLFVYPYVDARRSLEKIANSSVDEHFGYKLRYTDPATGSSPIPTIGAFLQLLPKGMRTRGYRSTDSTIYVCLEGHGSAFIEGERFPFVENDIFIVPSWKELEIEADEETTLYSYSDRPVQQMLGLWRESRA
ncbi:gentisate 1,2-dioxygenase [Pelagerythrobacter aerophilus]